MTLTHTDNINYGPGREETKSLVWEETLKNDNLKHISKQLKKQVPSNIWELVNKYMRDWNKNRINMLKNKYASNLRKVEKLVS